MWTLKLLNCSLYFLRFWMWTYHQLLTFSYKAAEWDCANNLSLAFNKQQCTLLQVTSKGCWKFQTNTNQISKPSDLWCSADCYEIMYNMWSSQNILMKTFQREKILKWQDRPPRVTKNTEGMRWVLSRYFAILNLGKEEEKSVQGTQSWNSDGAIIRLRWRSSRHPDY